jgi:hypothetical protein
MRTHKCHLCTAKFKNAEEHEDHFSRYHWANYFEVSQHLQKFNPYKAGKNKKKK